MRSRITALTAFMSLATSASNGSRLGRVRRADGVDRGGHASAPSPAARRSESAARREGGWRRADGPVIVAAEEARSTTMRELVRSAWLIAAAVLIPLLLFVGVPVGIRRARGAPRDRAALAGRGAVDRLRVRRGARADDRRDRGAVDDPGAAAGDIAGAYRRVARNRRAQPGLGQRRADAGCATGRVLFDLRRPLGAGLLADARPARAAGTRGRRGRARAAAAARASRSSARAPGPDGGYVLTVLMSVEPFLRLLPPTPAATMRSARSSTRDGRFVARSLNHDERVGTPASTYLREAIASGKPSGIYRGFTLEGFENYTAFARSATTGWSRACRDGHAVARQSGAALPAARSGSAALLSAAAGAGADLVRAAPDAPGPAHRRARAAGAEARGAGPADRRDRARLQQSADPRRRRARFPAQARPISTSARGALPTARSPRPSERAS